MALLIYSNLQHSNLYIYLASIQFNSIMALISILCSMLLPSALILILIIFYVSLNWNPNGIPWNWPFLGMVPTVVYHLHRINDRVTEILRQSSSTFFFKAIWFANIDFLLTADPSNIHHILSTNFQRYPKGPDFKSIFDVLGDGIFNSDSDLWRDQRRVAHSLVRREKFLRFLGEATMKKVKEGLVPVLDSACENGSLLDLQDLFQRFSFDSTCMLVTGFDLHSLSLDFPQVPFSKAMDEVEEIIFVRHYFPKTLWKLLDKFQIGTPKRQKEACEIIDQTIAKLIALKRESLQKEKSVEGADLITSYMIDKEYGSEKDDKFLRDTLLNFMIAGRDTLSAALSWFFFCLSNNPIVEAKIREELKTIIPVDEGYDQWLMFNSSFL